MPIDSAVIRTATSASPAASPLSVAMPSGPVVTVRGVASVSGSSSTAFPANEMTRGQTDAPATGWPRGPSILMVLGLLGRKTRACDSGALPPPAVIAEPARRAQILDRKTKTPRNSDGVVRRNRPSASVVARTSTGATLSPHGAGAKKRTWASATGLPCSSTTAPSSVPPWN